MYALYAIKILERCEVKIKKYTDFDAYNGAKEPLPLILEIIQTHQLTPTGDLLIDEDATVQAYPTTKLQIYIETEWKMR